ncbi:multidrug resistance efflux transporter family protein [Azotosporobacter soli]|uniref:DMT family transporter n=1 Tax=Azotosporobacter soli TaxID=3055040 RepID=UPI0031FF052F
MKQAIGYGILASLFFAVTFILNRSMNAAGDSYLWSAALRYLFMLPFLFLIVYRRRQTTQVYRAIKNEPAAWLLWSSVGFGLFYLPLTFAANYGESWLIAGLWQCTIVAGILLSPLWGVRIPGKNLAIAAFILIGVFVLQMEKAAGENMGQNYLYILAVLVAAVAYPLGNRKMMLLCRDELNTTQRVFGMTLCSMPFWLLTAGAALLQSGLFSWSQAMQSLIVALFSGVVATLLFFKATTMVMHNAKKLAVIEATQAGEVVFSLLGGCLLLGDALPTTLGCIGLLVIVIGMLANSLTTAS